MIKLLGISKSFGDKKLFTNVSFEIKDGEFVAFTGESGSGKTTLLNIIGGLEKTDSGEVLIDDRNISKGSEQIWLYGEKIGFLFQNFALVEQKTVRENLELVKKKFRSEKNPKDALSEVGLLDKLDSKVFTLSGGEQQRVALARLMVKKCDIILADEPTGSLDKSNAQRVFDLLRKLNTEGKTVIIVTHDPEIAGQCDRVIDISNGNFADA